VLLIEEAKGTSVTKSTLRENDIGFYHLAGVETTKPQATIVSSKLEANRYEGVTLDQGFATVNKDEITGPGNVGIQVLQYEGQSFGPKGTGTEDKVSGMTAWAVEGLSDLAPGDEAGSFKISNSAISGNPGPTPKESVHTNNQPKLPIILGAGNT
jgi:hypothetical protein